MCFCQKVGYQRLTKSTKTKHRGFRDWLCALLLPAFRDWICALTWFFEIGFDTAPGFSRCALCFVVLVDLVTRPDREPLKAEIPAHRYILTLSFASLAHAEQLILQNHKTRNLGFIIHCVGDSGSARWQTSKTMSSLDIAKLCGKRHHNVLGDIRRTLRDHQLDPGKFEGKYTSAGNRPMPCYNLPRDKTWLVVEKYPHTPAKRIMRRWDEMEGKDSTTVPAAEISSVLAPNNDGIVIETCDVPTDSAGKPQTMSSLIIAKLCGKRHHNVLGDIRRALRANQLDPRDFEDRYTAANNRSTLCYNLPRKETLLVAGKYDYTCSEPVMQLWDEMEGKPSVTVPADDENADQSPRFLSIEFRVNSGNLNASNMTDEEWEILRRGRKAKAEREARRDQAWREQAEKDSVVPADPEDIGGMPEQCYTDADLARLGRVLRVTTDPTAVPSTPAEQSGDLTREKVEHARQIVASCPTERDVERKGGMSPGFGAPYGVTKDAAPAFDIVIKDGQFGVDLRELQQELGSKRQFGNWADDRLSQFVEGQDFVSLNNIVKRETGASTRKDYAVSIECAKHIAMMENTERGKQVRQYFLECEKALKGRHGPVTPALPQDVGEALQLAADLWKQQNSAQPPQLQLETQELKAELAAKDELLRTSLANNQEAILQIEAKDAQLEAQAPAVKAHDKFLATGDNITMREAAKRLEVDEQKLINACIKRRLIYRGIKDRLEAYAPYRASNTGKGYFTYKKDLTAVGKEVFNMVVTPKGLSFMENSLDLS